jgi:hypothetical protein
MRKVIHMKKTLLLLLASAIAIYATGCADAQVDELGLNLEDPELGKSLFEPAREADEAKEDSLIGKEGLLSSVDASATAVWEVTNQWSDVDTAAAKKAGMAWGENSGLTWDDKYSLWVDEMEKRDAVSYGTTLTFITPFGKTLPAPSLECAEVALFLRGTFASWYNLPFFVEARDSKGKRLYLGHFGFRTAQAKYANSPNFKTAYADYSPEAELWDARGWPRDERLRKRRLGGSQDDEQVAIGEGAHAGTYFDEIYLNKRAGYFMIYLLSYFGSVNLADPSNTFNVTAESIMPGDVLLERWQRRGIGHALIVKEVYQPEEGFFEVELMSGSMPRRQPKWESTASSKYALTNENTGGPDLSRDDIPFYKLGGGLKRWRTAVLQSDRWTNIVPNQYRQDFIRSNDYNKISSRVETFRNLIVELPPERKRESILERIQSARMHLSLYPASCAARIRREDAFKELYNLEATEFYTSREDVDETYRKLDDYVLSALVYEESKTCCWNSSTAEMYSIIMDYARKEQASMGDACYAPTVFKATNGGYEIWQEYAAEIGRSSQWVEWSEDELCAQRNTVDDVIDNKLAGTAYCELNTTANVYSESQGN